MIFQSTNQVMPTSLRRTPMICFNCAILFGFVFSIATAVWGGINLLMVLTTFSHKPDDGTWTLMLWLTIWSFFSGVLYIVDQLLESFAFDWWITIYLMVTWLGFTGITVWKSMAWLKMGETSLVYVNFAQMLIGEAIFMNAVNILAIFFPHDQKPEKTRQYPIGYVYQPVILIR